MPLTGQAKKEYQREYMRSYMSNRRSVKTHPGMLRPSRVFVKTQVRPVKDSGLAPDGFPIQHNNSMMVGYVPKG